MKKIYLAALTLAMTACVSNDDLNPVDIYGYIDVNVSNNPVMVTRASVDNLSSWTITADGETDYNLGETTKVKAGTYSITAKNATDVNVANAHDNNWGKPYYEKTVDNISVIAGETKHVTIDCGTAKNSKLTLVNSLNSNVFTNVKLHAKKGESYLAMDGTKSVFYSVNTNVEYYITYNYNYTDVNGTTQSEEKVIKNTVNSQEQNFNIEIANAATDYQITLSSTDNGTIKVTLTYDDSFNTNNSTTLEFDAATGIQKQ